MQPAEHSTDRDSRMCVRALKPARNSMRGINLRGAVLAVLTGVLAACASSDSQQHPTSSRDQSGSGANGARAGTEIETQGGEALRDLAADFNRTLSGRYPFRCGAGRVGGPQADYRELARFLRRYGDARAALVEAGTAASKEGAAASRAARFIEVFDPVNAFFAPLLPSANGPATGVYDITVELPPPPVGSSAGTEDIVEWTFEIGRDTRAPLTNGGTGFQLRWQVGDEITVGFAWAKTSSARPVSDLSQPRAKLKEEWVHVEFEGPWALVSLLREHGVPGRDLSRAGFSDGMILEFEIPTATAGRPDIAGRVVRPRLRLAISAAGSNDPLKLPAFPERVPLATAERTPIGSPRGWYLCK